MNNNVTSRGGRRRGGCNSHKIINIEDLLGDSDDNDNNDKQQQQQQTFDLATNWIQRVNKIEGDVDYFIVRIDDKSLDENTICSIVGKHENANPQAGLFL